METISIKVDTEVAKAYRDADADKQEKLSSVIKLFFDSNFAEKSLTQVMEEIADKAETRGLKPEILESILNDDE